MDPAAKRQKDQRAVEAVSAHSLRVFVAIGETSKLTTNPAQSQGTSIRLREPKQECLENLGIVLDTSKPPRACFADVARQWLLRCQTDRLMEAAVRPWIARQGVVCCGGVRRDHERDSITCSVRGGLSPKPRSTS